MYKRHRTLWAVDSSTPLNKYGQYQQTFSFYNAIDQKSYNENFNIGYEQMCIAYKKYMLDIMTKTINDMENDQQLTDGHHEYLKTFKISFLTLITTFNENKITPAQFKQKAKQAINVAHSNLDGYSGWGTRLYNIACIIASIVTVGLFNLAVYDYSNGQRFFPASIAPEGTYEKELEYLLEDVQACSDVLSPSMSA